MNDVVKETEQTERNKASEKPPKKQFSIIAKSWLLSIKIFISIYLFQPYPPRTSRFFSSLYAYSISFIYWLPFIEKSEESKNYGCQNRFFV